MKGPVLQFPVAVGRDHGVLQPVRGQERPEVGRDDGGADLPGHDQDLERPGDQGAQPGSEPAEHEHHGRPPLRFLGHDRRASRRGCADVDPAWKSAVGAGKDVNWPTGTGGKGNSGVAAVVKQTDWRDRLRRAGVRARERLHVRGDQELGRLSTFCRRSPTPRPRSWGSRSRRT